MDHIELFLLCCTSSFVLSMMILPKMADLKLSRPALLVLVMVPLFGCLYAIYIIAFKKTNFRIDHRTIPKD